MAQAEADSARIQGLAEAEVIRAKGEAEAEAIRLKSLAEAEGMRAQYLAEAEGMMQKAKAWQEYNEAAVSQMLIEKMPEIAAAVASPLSKIDKITLVSSGGTGSAGMDKITQGVTDVLSQLPGVVETMSGVKLPELLQRLPGIAKSEKNGA